VKVITAFKRVYPVVVSSELKSEYP